MKETSLGATLVEVLRRYVAPGETWIEVGCGAEPLSISAATLQPQGVLAIDSDADAVAIAAQRVLDAGLQDVIRLACADFTTWPLIPATHALCRVQPPKVFDLLPRLRLAARGGVIVLTNIADDALVTLSDRCKAERLQLTETAPASEGAIVVCRSATTPSAAFQANFRA